MRLERVELRNFRGVAASRIDFSDGVTIVAGPNEVGKSSVRDAIRLIRDFKHSSRHQTIRSAQPVGRDVGPEIELHLTSGGYRMRYAKRWIREAFTELHVTAPSPQRPEQHSGDAAHDRFLEILAETVDMDLLQALDVAQGASLDQPALAGIAALRGALDDGGEHADGHDTLMERIEEEYSRYFTASGRPTGEYRTLTGRLEELECDVEDLEQQSREMDRLTEDHERETRRFTTDEEQLAAAKEKLTKFQAKDRTLADLRTEQERRQRGTAEARRARQDAEAARRSRAGAITALDERAEAITELTEQVTQLESAARVAAGGRDTAAQRAEEAGQRSEARRKDADFARHAFDRAQDEATLADLTRRLERARESDRERLEAAARLDGPALEEGLLEGLGELRTQVMLARRTREAAAARVVVQRLGSTPVRLNSEAVKDEAHASVTDLVEVEAEGILRVEVQPGSAPADLDRAVADAQEELRHELDGIGADSVDAARRMAETRAEALAARDRATGTLEAVLGEQKLLDLTERVALLTARLTGSAESEDAPGEDAANAPGEDAGEDPAHPDGLDCPAASAADLEALREAVATAEEAVRDAQVDVAEAGRVRERDRAAADVADQALMRAQVMLDQHHDEHDLASGRLTQVRAETSDDDLDAALEAATTALTEAEQAEERSRAALEGADAERIGLELENAQAALTSVADRLTQTRDRLSQVRARLDDHAALGIYDKLEAARADLEAARDRHDRLHRSALAISLLRETMLRHRQQAHRKYVAPFKDRIDRLGRLVFGDGFDVQVGEGLEIISRTLDGDTVPFASLSAGAREQLALIGRLACAQLIDPDDGAPVILDDTLGFADPDRLESLNLVLGTVGRSAQVVIFTCQESRFAGIGGASTVRLPSAGRRG